MTAINFPDSPSVNDEFSVDGRTWKWTGVFWEFVGSLVTETALDTKLNLSGGTMTGVLTLSGTPTLDQHASTKIYVDTSVDNSYAILEQVDLDILSDLNTINTSISDIENSIVTINNNADTLSSEVDTISTDVTTIETDLGSLTTQVDGISTNITGIETSIGTLETDVETLEGEIELKSPIESPTFTGTVVLPGTTSIGTITSSEIGHLSGVTSAIQDQIDDKLNSAIASSTYAPLNDPTFGGTVSLPGTTSIGDISSTELGYLNGVTSSIQTQLTDLDTTKADLESPTFTGTVSGITSSMVGLGSVDNTSDLNKPVSTAQQTALDAKLNLSGGTMTGKITLDGDPTQALHAVTKQYVDSVEAGLITRPQVRAATTSNLTANYSNGTLGVGATLTSTSNGAFPLIDNVALTTVNGARGILVKNQTNSAHNGRYNLTTQGDSETPWVLTRCALCDEADEIPGSYIFVTDGDVNGGTGWIQNVSDPATFVVGTDDITVFQFSGAGTVTAGTNIAVSGNQISVINAPIFSGTVDASASGVEFSDGVQTKAGVPTLTTFVEKTASYTLDTLAHQDNVIEMNSTSPMTFTVPTNAALAWPIGASMDILQTNTGEVTIAASGGVTLNRTPGNKLRTQWSSATILKRGTDSWILYGDLKA
jgi:archaellum component FlaC